MYRLGKRGPNRHRRTVIISSIVAVVVITGAALYIFTRGWTSTAKIQNPPAISSTLSADTTKTQLIHESAFSFNLPLNWKLMTHQTAPNNVYTYTGTTGSDQSRLLSVYVDNLPLTMAVNRVVAVRAQGNSISHDTVSDNCNNFAGEAARNTPQAQTQGVTLSRWDGVDFYCDIGNYNRDVTGISVADSINKLTLSDAASGAHSFYLTYTDNNISPSFTELYSVLESFHLN